MRELFRVRAALEGLAASQIISSADRRAAADSLRAALVRLVEPDTDFIAVSTPTWDSTFCSSAVEEQRPGRLLRHLEGRFRLVIVAAGPVRAQPLMSRERHNAIIDTIESGSISALSTRSTSTWPSPQTSSRSAHADLELLAAPTTDCAFRLRRCDVLAPSPSTPAATNHSWCSRGAYCSAAKAMCSSTTCTAALRSPRSIASTIGRCRSRDIIVGFWSDS